MPFSLPEGEVLSQPEEDAQSLDTRYFFVNIDFIYLFIYFSLSPYICYYKYSV